MRKAVANEIEKIMKKNKKVILIVGDLGFSLFDNIKKKFPERFINAGIGEQAMISIAAGLAKIGKIPIVYSIIPFLVYRPFEQIFLDVAYHKLPVILIGSSEGFSYGEEGISHFALNDLGLITQIPNIEIYTPAEAIEAREYLRIATKRKKPTYIRLVKMKNPYFEDGVKRKNGFTIINEGGKKQIMVMGYGGISLELQKVKDEIKKINKNIGIYHVGKIRPLNKDLEKKIKDAKKIITIEEHYKVGGLASYLTAQYNKKIQSIAVETPFIKKIGRREYMLTKNFLDNKNILKRIKKYV